MGKHLGLIGRAAGAAGLAITLISTSTFATAPTIPAGDAGTISGIGATFPAPFYNELFAQFKADNPSATVAFTYAANGSGAGVTAIKNQTADYGASDAALSDADVAATSAINGGVLHVPATIGGVVLAYRLSGVKSTATGRAVTLKLTKVIISKIYAGQIVWWDNATIKSANPGVTIPHKRITAVRRSDSSGTTFVFQSYLYNSAAVWRCILGAPGAQKLFPTGAQSCLAGKSIPGVGAPRNSGVAAKIASTNGAIGYVEYAYAITGGLKMARVKNASGVYVTPSTYAFSAAAARAIGSVPSDLRAAPMVNVAGVTSWPITSYSYLLVYKNLDFMGSLTKAQMFVAYTYYALTTGQNFARSMGYAPLPASVKTKALAKIHQLTYGGNAVWP